MTFWKFLYKVDYFRYFCLLTALIIPMILLCMFFVILFGAKNSIIKHGLNFIYGTTWSPNQNIYGVLPALIGTIISSTLAVIIALPFGISIAIFTSEKFFSQQLSDSLKFAIEILAAIPSVVYGLWGTTILVPLVQKYIPIFANCFFSEERLIYGNSLFTATLVLSIMILPTITSLSTLSLSSVPQFFKEDSYALGATCWETIWHISLPTAFPGIFSATILAYGRAIGETIAVSMLIGNNQHIPSSIFEPSTTCASLIANQFSEAYGMHMSALMNIALILLMLSFFVNLCGSFLVKKLNKKNIENAI